MISSAITSVDVDVQYLRIIDQPEAERNTARRSSSVTAGSLVKDGRVYLTLTIDGSGVVAQTAPVDMSNESPLLDFSNQPDIHIPLRGAAMESEMDENSLTLRIRLFQNLRSKKSEQEGKSPKLVIAAEGKFPVDASTHEAPGESGSDLTERRSSRDSDALERTTDVELWSTDGQRLVAVVGIRVTPSARIPGTPRNSRQANKSSVNPLVAASSPCTLEGDETVCSPDPAAISPQLEGRKLLREITDKLVTSNPGHVRAGGVEGGDGRSKETSKGGMTTAITGPASMKEFYDQMQRWSLMCGPYREIHDTMHDIAHWKGDTAKTWLFLLVSTIACLHPGWILPSLPWVAIGFWYLRLIKRIQETALRQRRKSSTAETEGRKRDTDKDTESSKSGVYDWMQKLQDKQREVELNLQYNQTVTQQGLRMLESFRNINPREALVMSAILAIPLTIGFLLVPFNFLVLLSIYATLGYNMLSDEMAENLRRFVLHHFEGIMDRFLSRSASARQLVEIVQTVSEDSPKAQQAASAVTAKHERRSPSGETGGGALSELARSRSSGDKARVFVTYENQRWWVTGGWGHHTFAGERSAWSDEYGQFYCPKESFQLPKGPGRWEWTSLWYVDRSADGDVEGWEYAPSFSAANEDGFHSEMRRSDVVRRRRWCRRCRMVPGSDLDNPAASPSKGARQISSV